MTTENATIEPAVETSRKLASIQCIKSLNPIPGADKIEVAEVLGWQVVVEKGLHKVGDKIIYCEIDSVLPEDPQFEFLRSKSFRIKTIRLRKQISQGIVFPLSILTVPGSSLNEGEDVTGIMGIKKYEPPIPTNLRGQILGLFPSFIPKTDETRIQAAPEVLVRHKGKTFYITEKLDGTSMTVYHRDGHFGVCSRNLEYKPQENLAYWEAAVELNLEGKLKRMGNFAVQGELFGKGIQGNKYTLSNKRFAIFNIFDIDKYRYLDFEDFRKTAKDNGFEMVPVLESQFTLNHSVLDLVELSKKASSINAMIPQEGMVMRPLVEDRDDELGRLSFKIINPEFLLKFNE